MNINCVICSDLFVTTADIYTTRCGHMFHYHCILQWLETSETCPQCRGKASPETLMRLFLNVCSTENDASVLQHKLDEVDFQMKLKDKDISTLTTKEKDLKEEKAALKIEIEKMKIHEDKITATLKEKSIQCNEFKIEIGNLKKKIRELENLQTAVRGNSQPVHEIIRNGNIKSVGLIAATLKRRELDSLKVDYEKEATERKVQEKNSNQPLNNNIQIIMNNSPSNCNLIPVPPSIISQIISITPPTSSTALPVIQSVTHVTPLPVFNLVPLQTQNSVIGTNSDNKPKPRSIQPKTNSLVGYNEPGCSSQGYTFPSPQEQTFKGLKRLVPIEISPVKMRKINSEEGAT